MLCGELLDDVGEPELSDDDVSVLVGGGVVVGVRVGGVVWGRSGGGTRVVVGSGAPPSTGSGLSVVVEDASGGGISIVAQFGRSAHD